MNKEEIFVITISRQFGTGGHEIGAELARRLGVKLLDKQILNAVAARVNAVEEAVEKIEARNPLSLPKKARKAKKPSLLRPKNHASYSVHRFLP